MSVTLCHIGWQRYSDENVYVIGHVTRVTMLRGDLSFKPLSLTLTKRRKRVTRSEPTSVNSGPGQVILKGISSEKDG